MQTTYIYPFQAMKMKKETGIKLHLVVLISIHCKKNVFLTVVFSLHMQIAIMYIMKMMKTQ